MKTILLSAFLLPFLTFALRNPESIPEYYLEYKEDTSLKPGKAKVTFVCNHYIYAEKNDRQLHYGINGSSEKIIMNAEGKASAITQPKKGIFKFFYNSHYLEITTDSIELKSGMETIITLHFKSSEFETIEEKPIIYLYPEVQTNVSVTVNPVGEMTFTYPQCSGTWNVTAQPNGSLEINGKNYPYLFWEASDRIQNPFSDQSGFIVNNKNVIAFLEEKLTTLGLNPVEQTDFITYWGPRLTAHDQCKVKFVINEQCDQFAELNISPKPDHINRVYIVWSAATGKEQLSAQSLSTLNREGFDVLEWGGMQIPATILTASQTTY